jgi:hypothetical protein
MKIFGYTIKNKTWKSLLFILPLAIVLFSYQQCSRSCDIEVSREVGSTRTLPSCSLDSTVACIHDGRSCGDHSDGTTWFADGDDSISKERVCKYGETVKDTYIQQVEYVCKDGEIALTGELKEGPVSTAGQCSETPFNCGAHLDSTTWWETDTDLEKVPRVCADSTVPAFNYYSQEKELKCDNGKVVPTTLKRLKNLEKVDSCPTENNCGSHTEGSTWFEGMGTIQSPRICSDTAKTPVIDIYVRKIELKCSNGVSVDQAVTLQGDLISYGECPGSVKCGNHIDGETWKEVDGELTESIICSDKLTSSETRFKKVIVKQCTNGVITVKNTEKGDMLSIGVCPRSGCAPYLDGEKWLADLGLQVSQPKACPFGPVNPEPVITYINLQEAKCSNGSVVPTGYLQRGDKKSETTCYSCAPNSKQTCSVANGNGSQVCKADGSGFNSCILETCKPGFYNNNGTCTPQVCTPSSKTNCEFNATSTGTKTCNANGSAYGSCIFEGCRPGNVKIPDVGDKKNICVPAVCTPNAIDKTGCASIVTAVPAGAFERQCNNLGTAFNSCILKCTDGSAVRDGKCTTYSWVATSNWSTCSADCGGSQTQEYVCKSNFGETVSDTKCTKTVKPIISRQCNLKTAAWTDGFEEIAPSTREVCPGLFLGYIEKIYKQPISYSCVDFKKVKSLGTKVLATTNNYCSAIQPARCSHDSLSIPESLKRLNWMKACESKVPAIKTFFEIIGGADQLSTYLNDTTSTLYGKARPRPLYVTFSDQANLPWIAPKIFTTNEAANCTVPANVKIFGICTSSCYTPDQKLLFNVAGKQQYIPIIDAIGQKQGSIMTLAPESVIEKLKFTSAPIAHFISELVDTNHKILTFHTNLGGKLSVTFNHPLVASDGVIREASDFKVGDQLIRADGSFDEIRSIDEMIYPGKVHNVLPYGESTIGNIIVAEGFLSGSAYFQNDGVNYLNQKILRSNLLQGIDLKK